MTHDEDLDATGLICPLPVLKARKRMRSLPDGAVLRLTTTDPAAVVDVPHFCTENGYALIGQEDDGAAIRFYIRKAAGQMPNPA